MFVFKYSYKNTVATNRAKGVAVFEGSPIRYNIAQLILSAIFICGRLHFIARGKIIPFKSEQYSEFIFSMSAAGVTFSNTAVCVLVDL